MICPRCNGSGRITDHEYRLMSEAWNKLCPECNGTGLVSDKVNNSGVKFNASGVKFNVSDYFQEAAKVLNEASKEEPVPDVKVDTKEVKQLTSKDVLYEFCEPHISGGDCTIKLTAQQAVDWLRSNNKRYVGISDKVVFEDFIVSHWASRVNKESE